jgi:uncharacterized protein
MKFLLRRVNEMEHPIGKIISGGIARHLIASLDINSERLETGTFIVCPGTLRRYYALVVDVMHNAGLVPEFVDQPVEGRLPVNLAARVNRKVLKPKAELMLNLCLDNDAINSLPQPVTALPPMHAPVYLADAQDIERIFGVTTKPGNFVIGYTREQGHPVALDLSKLIKRSTAFFSSTGGGKSQLAKVALAGVIQSGLAATLTLDFHSEYGFDDVSESNAVIPGLKSMFPNRVTTFALGKNATVRGIKPDRILEIAMSEIQPSEILQMQDLLALTENTATVIGALTKSYGANWLRDFLRLTRNSENSEDGKKTPAPGSVEFWANSVKISVISASALWSKLKYRIGRLPYMVDQPTPNGVQSIITELKAGRHVVISFGEHDSPIDCALVANIVGNQVAAVWEQDAENYRSNQKVEPRRLVLVVEEAHKLLMKGADSPVYTRLSREGRKDFATLWIVDQRPSEISPEVLSQVGTRVLGWLGNENDLDAAIIGLPGRDMLRRILSNIQPNGVFLIAGYGVPTPILVKSRWLDDKFKEEMRSLQP